MGKVELERDTVARSLYDAALSGDWSPALADLCTLLGGGGAIIEVHPKPVGAPLLMLGHGMPSGGLEAYERYYHRVCPRLPDPNTPSGTVDYDYRHLDEAQIARNEFYQDFLGPDGLKHFVGGVVHNTDDEIALLGVHYSARREHASAEEIAVAQSLLGDVARAISIYRRLAAASHETRALRATLDLLTVGTVVVDRRGHTLFSNRAANELTSHPTPLTIHPALSVREARDRTKLDHLAQELSAGRGVSVLLGREHALLVIAAPLGRSELGESFELPDSSHAVLFLADPQHSVELRERVLRSVYRLTGAEQDLAQALVHGQTVAEFAYGRGVRLSTARTHMARLRSKLGAKRQADVIRILLALHPPIR